MRLFKKSLLSRGLYLLLMGSVSLQIEAQTISLGDILESTRKHYPKILIAKQQVEVERLNLLKAQGAFDPSVNSTTTSIPRGGYESGYNDTIFSVPLTSYGAQFFVRYRNGQGEWPIYFKNFLTNSLGEGSVGLILPLLQGSEIDQMRAALKASKLNIDKSKRLLELEINSALNEAGVAYWYWVALAKRYDLTNKLLELSLVRQKALTKRKNLGDSADIDLVENKRFILQRSANLIKIKNELKNAGQVLSLFWRDANGQPKIPNYQSAPRDISHAYLSKKLTIENIIDINPQLNAMKKQIEIQGVNVKLTKNMLLPKLDLTVSSKKQYGIDGDPLLKQTSYNFGLVFNMPLPLREARAKYQISRVKLNQIIQDYQLLRQSVKVTIRRILNDLRAMDKQINIFTQELRLAYKIENAERIKFKEGDSSLFLLNQREQTTFSLQIKLLSAQIAYNVGALKLRALCNFSNQCR